MPIAAFVVYLKRIPKETRDKFARRQELKLKVIMYCFLYCMYYLNKPVFFN